jgi:ABC-type transporter Mla subunit MlaD
MAPSKTAQRVIGILLIVVGIMGIALVILGAIFGARAVGQLAADVRAALPQVVETLDTVQATLVQVKTTLGTLTEGLVTLSGTLANTSQVIEATGALAEQVTQMVGQNVPDRIDEVQSVLVDVGSAAETIDSALSALNKLSFGLVDINIADDVPLAKPVSELGTSLNNLSRDVQSVESSLSSFAQAAEPLGQDLKTVARDLATLSADLEGFAPLIDSYIATVDSVREDVAQAGTEIDRLERTLKTVMWIGALWIGLLHITPLYLGWELVSGQRNDPSTSSAEYKAT